MPRIPIRRVPACDRFGNLCPPLYFLALAFWPDHRPGWALLLAAWAILIKEEAAIVIGTFGLYLALFENHRKPGLIIAAAAFAHQPCVALSRFPAIGKSHAEPSACHCISWRWPSGRTIAPAGRCCSPPGQSSSMRKPPS